jgi:Family of unknown function (DUF6311)
VLAAAAAATFGAAAFAFGVGLGTLDPRRLDWILIGGIDPSVHFLGWHMFRHEPWTQPLGAIRSFGHPVGTSIALTDSVPVVALALKPFDPLLPGDFQYIGLWLLCSFVLQGVFAALLMATATPRLALRLLGTSLLILSPLLIHRLTHTSLTAHWLILAALLLYVENSHSPRWQLLAKWAALVAVSVAIHPYLSAMVLAIAAATLARRAARDGLPSVGFVLIVFAALGGIAFLVAWQVGYFVVTDAGDLQGPGIGLLSMNLLSPVMPLQWSTLLGPGPFGLVSSAQNEGYAYAGAGMLFLAVVLVSLLATRNWIAHPREWFRSHWPIVLVCVGLTVLALSPKVTLGTRTLFEYDARWWGPLTLFRASGRMFWPVYYALTFGAVSVLVRSVSTRRAVAVLAIAVTLQAMDLSGAYRNARQARATRLAELLPDPFWRTVPGLYQHLILHPTNMCPAAPGTGLDFRLFAIIAGRFGNTINAGFAARYDAEKVLQYCRAFDADMRAGRVADDQLYVMVPQLAAPLKAAAQKPLVCTVVDGYAACFTVASYERWRQQVTLPRIVQ